MYINPTSFYVVEIQDRLGFTLSHKTFFDLPDAFAEFDSEIAWYNTEDNITMEDLHQEMDDSYVFISPDKVIMLYEVDHDTINVKIN